MSAPPNLIDLHEDIAIYYSSGEGYGFEADAFDNDLPGRQGDLPKYRKAGLKIVFASVFPLIGTLDRSVASMLSRGYGEPNSAFASVSSTLVAQELIKVYSRLQRQFSDQITIVESRDDEVNILKHSKVGFLVALEGTEAIQVPSDLELFWKLGVRSLQITWNFDTKYASSCMSEKDYGLTGSGRTLLERANELGIIVDLAHAGKKSCLEALEVSDLPVLISHANSSSVNNHSRNVDDEVLDLLRKNRGVIGFTLIPDTFGKPLPTVEDLAEHIEYARDNFGSEIVALGTDYFGLLPPDKPPARLEDISKIDNLWEALRKRCFNEEEREALSFGNPMRVIETNASRWKT